MLCVAAAAELIGNHHAAMRPKKEQDDDGWWNYQSRAVGNKGKGEERSQRILAGPRRPTWGCSCGTEGIWACSIQCHVCHKSCPNYVRVKAEAAARKEKEGGGGGKGGATGGGKSTSEIDALKKEVKELRLAAGGDVDMDEGRDKEAEQLVRHLEAAFQALSSAGSSEMAASVKVRLDEAKAARFAAKSPAAQRRAAIDRLERVRRAHDKEIERQGGLRADMERVALDIGASVEKVAGLKADLLAAEKKAEELLTSNPEGKGTGQPVLVLPAALLEEPKWKEREAQLQQWKAEASNALAVAEASANAGLAAPPAGPPPGADSDVEAAASETQLRAALAAPTPGPPPAAAGTGNAGAAPPPPGGGDEAPFDAASAMAEIAKGLGMDDGALDDLMADPDRRRKAEESVLKAKRTRFAPYPEHGGGGGAGSDEW